MWCTLLGMQRVRLIRISGAGILLYDGKEAFALDTLEENVVEFVMEIITVNECVNILLIVR